jgi:hypothetical protein
MKGTAASSTGWTDERPEASVREHVHPGGKPGIRAYRCGLFVLQMRGMMAWPIPRALVTARSASWAARILLPCRVGLGAGGRSHMHEHAKSRSTASCIFLHLHAPHATVGKKQTHATNAMLAHTPSASAVNMAVKTTILEEPHRLADAAARTYNPLCDHLGSRQPTTCLRPGPGMLIGETITTLRKTPLVCTQGLQQRRLDNKCTYTIAGRYTYHYKKDAALGASKPRSTHVTGAVDPYDSHVAGRSQD